MPTLLPGDLAAIEMLANMPTSTAAAKCRANIPLLVGRVRELEKLVVALIAWDDSQDGDVERMYKLMQEARRLVPYPYRSQRAGAVVGA